MARITSIGMPRKTFVASAKEDAAAHSEAGPSTSPADDEAPKKKTHRAGKKIKRKLERADARAAGDVLPEDAPKAVDPEERAAKRAKKKDAAMQAGYMGAAAGGGGGWGRNPEIARKAKLAEERTEARRLQRISEKQQSLTCFACRESGHTARDCPNVLDAQASGSAAALQSAEAGSRGGEVVGGKCYRTHSLSQCHKPANPDNPTPYATCYVCLGQGHLSSACPSNAKGVYVNGGSCKICGSVAHLVRNCPKIRAQGEDEERRDEWRGTKRSAGADEDDDMIEGFAMVQRSEEGGKKGKKAKHPPNNNGLREPYKGADGEVRVQLASAKKAKVVSF